jgi:SAM-dependent methyltransferase
MNLIIEVIKNYLILIPQVKYLAKKHHLTGANNDEKIVAERFSILLHALSLEPACTQKEKRLLTVAEFGPGQTFDLIAKVLHHTNAAQAYACDVECYLPRDYMKKLGVKYIKTTQHSNGLPDSYINFAYCFDVLEHVREPKSFLRDVWRALSPGGIFFAKWDLRDHFHLDKEELWFNMHRYDESTWSLMTSNRTNFVNRLQRQEWVELIREAGFEVVDITCEQSKLARESIFRTFTQDIDGTYMITAVLRKPSGEESAVLSYS